MKYPSVRVSAQSAGREAYVHVAGTLQLPEAKVRQALQLLDAGNTIPFVARYRKEATGGLDEVQLRAIAEGAQKFRTLEERKSEVLRLIGEQEKLTPQLEVAICGAASVQVVEDLYRPYRPKRRTRASVARERGLEPLAEALLQAGTAWPSIERMAKEAAVKADLPGWSDALTGASDILAERVSDDPTTRARVRDITQRRGFLASTCALPQERLDERTPYETYYDFSRPVREVRPHAVLAIGRGEREGVLKVSVEIPEDAIIAELNRLWIKGRDQHVVTLLENTLHDAYNRLLRPSIERELRRQLTESAGAHAIGVFARNLASLLMQPPVRGVRVLGVDPGFRTGCKLAVVDETGRLLDTATMYPHPPQNRMAEAVAFLRNLIATHQVNLVAIGNGTASRETELAVAQAIEALSDVHYVVVSEAGASVYSASELAGAELPELDVSLRGAVSIARRLQDPLAELVKIEPKAIGVGQYQHDVNQKDLAKALVDVVESCVNRVGINLNTASAALLQYVAGLTAPLSRRIVAYRDEHGPFSTRRDLLKVRGLGPKTFEQAAGFLRIPDGRSPLDRTAVHPESYGVAERILQAAGLSPASLGNDGAVESLRTLEPVQLAAALEAGVPTVTDIIEALLRPGLDPRTTLPPPPFRRDVIHIEDLHPGMLLTGTVANVVDFGVFVDVGLERAGLIHISKLRAGRIRHPLDVVAVGEPVEVEVLSVEPERQRISLALVRAEGNTAAQEGDTLHARNAETHYRGTKGRT